MKHEFDIYTRDIFEPRKITTTGPKVRIATASNEKASGRLNLQCGTGESLHISVRVTPAQHAAFHALGASAWLRSSLDAA